MAALPAGSLAPLLLLPGLVLACSATGGAGPPAPETDAVITGTVAYRERMALPPDAVVEVRLYDVSRQDAEAPLLAETIVRPEGRQVPLPFELRYDPARITPRGTYAVRATIRSGDRKMFTTDAVHRVITDGNPTRVDLLLRRAGGAPGGAQGGPAGSLDGTAWRLQDLRGAGVIAGAEATLEFCPPGRVGGKGSCNRFTGTVEVTGESIRFGRLGSTMMACAEAVGAQERQYFAALENAERYRVEGSTLLLYGRGSDTPSKFARIER